MANSNGHSDCFASGGFPVIEVIIAGCSLRGSLVVDWLLVRKKESAFRLRLFCWVDGGDDDGLSVSVVLVGSATYICVGCRHLDITGRS